jgi:hypothetical protein
MTSVKALALHLSSIDGGFNQDRQTDSLEGPGRWRTSKIDTTAQSDSHLVNVRLKMIIDPLFHLRSPPVRRTDSRTCAV